MFFVNFNDFVEFAERNNNVSIYFYLKNLDDIILRCYKINVYIIIISTYFCIIILY